VHGSWPYRTFRGTRYRAFQRDVIARLPNRLCTITHVMSVSEITIVACWQVTLEILTFFIHARGPFTRVACSALIIFLQTATHFRPSPPYRVTSSFESPSLEISRRSISMFSIGFVLPKSDAARRLGLTPTTGICIRSPDLRIFANKRPATRQRAALVTIETRQILNEELKTFCETKLLAGRDDAEFRPL